VALALADFLQAVGAGENEKAYALATAEYRKGHSLEEFSKEMDRVRADVDVAKQQFQMYLARQPKDDRPRQAAASAMPVRAKTGGRLMSFALRFSHEDGRWRVAQTELEELRGNPPNLLSEFRQVNGPAHSLPMAGAGSISFEARVTKLDEKSVTVEPIPLGKQDPPRPARTLEIDAKTEVAIIHLTENFKLPNGRTVPAELPVAARLQDLKVGHRVTVHTPPRQERVLKIVIWPKPVAPAPGL
jgi:hypothetical protein